MAERATHRPLLALLALATLLAGLCALQRLGGALAAMEGAERIALDLRFRLRGPTAAGDDVVIVAIDDASNTRHPELLERRATQAALLRAIAAGRPAVVGVDAIYLDPERLLSDDLAEEIRSYLSPRPELAAPEETTDARLHRSVGRE